MTDDEAKKISSAMENPEFRRLLKEYVDEISDPKNKKEYDDYIRQMEQQGELPAGSKLLRPEPGFCVKTKRVPTKGRSPSGDTADKLFVNICSSPMLDEPSSSRAAPGSGDKSGLNWSLPYSMGRPRPDRDNKGQSCTTVDIVYHPSALRMAETNTRFKAMLVDTALDSIQKFMDSQQSGDNVSRDYKILRRIKCKGDSPAVMTMQSNSNGSGGAAPVTQSSGPLVEPLGNSTTPVDSNVPSATDTVEAVKVESAKPISEPVYRIVHRGEVDLSDFMMTREPTRKSRPKELVVYVDMPQVKGIAEVNLDLSNQQFVLDVAGKYYLDIALPYPVNEEAGSAKWDKNKKQLTVTVPVVPAIQVIQNESNETETNSENC
eukprot:GILK01001432.1.p1 GENE.GILK01001432.1~~GILK01001432.1.p1  ORF type:complete len:395 (-),score=84.64 GILK01001432.1:167-1294(-)